MAEDAQLNQLREMSIKLDQMGNTLIELSEKSRPNKAAALKTLEDSAPEIVDEILAFIEGKLKGKSKAERAAVAIHMGHYAGANEDTVKYCLDQILSVRQDTSALDKVRKQRRLLFASYVALRDYLIGEGIDVSGVQEPGRMTGRGWARAT